MKHGKSLKATLPGIWRVLRQFSPQIRKQRFLILVSFIALLFEIGLQLVEPWPLKFIFDRIIATNSKVEFGIPALDALSPMVLLTILALAILAVTGLRAAAAYVSTVSMALAATHIMTEVRGNLYSHLQRLSLSFHTKAKSGDLITRVTNDTERLREVTVNAALPLLTNVLTLVGMLLVMFWLNWQLALIAIAAFPLFVFFTVRLTKRIYGVASIHRKQEGDMAAAAQEAMVAIKVVQALSLQKMLERVFKRQNQKSLHQGVRTQQLSAGLERTVEVLVAVATAMVMWRGAQLVLQKAITPGDLIVFINYLKTAFKPMRQLAKYVGQIAKATVSGERIVDIVEIVPDIRDLRGAVEAPRFKGAVRFEQMSFAYEPGKTILNNVNFEVQPGQHVALVGASGGGKSTLVSLLLRLYDPLEGRILIDGHDLREYKLESLRRQISIVLQDSMLFGVSIRDNIAYGSLGASQREIEAAARLANAHDFITALPQSYDTILGERGATLSGGQRQRIAIARAAIRQAPIVILDEPTTGLDNENERAVSEALYRLTTGRTTFLISHNLRVTERADLILFLEKGQISERGTHTELMRLGGRYAAMYTLQTASGTSNVAHEDVYPMKAQ